MPRVPLVPGITDAQKNLCAIASFLSECGIRKVKLLPYNPLWPDKMKKFGRDISGVASEMRQFLKPERIEECRANFLKAGIQPV